MKRPLYLCYDIKGIQQFIFSVPRLKCIIGASGLIVRFDRDAKKLDKAPGAEFERIFTAGGRGMFHCSNEAAATALEDQLITKAREAGLDLRIGIGSDMFQAMHGADRLYPYTPDIVTDETQTVEPCSMSGLWPVVANKGKGRNRDVHPMIWERVEMSRQDILGTFVLKDLHDEPVLPAVLKNFDLEFIKNVSPDPEDSEEEAAAVKVSQEALGGRNRWAVVALDGNDMGRQFVAFQRLGKSDDETRQWYKAMSGALETCTRRAFTKALGHVIGQWFDDTEARGISVHDCCVPKTKRLILPFRPLILGGDDVTILCHPTYAMSFTQNMARCFRAESANCQLDPLWPASAGELTMSAGILYTKVSFPLHMAIPYAEELLRHAKDAFRQHDYDSSEPPKQPTPAAVDWDAITETLIDTPTARRWRELSFQDDELKRTVHLTQRPYLMEDSAYEAPHLSQLLQLRSNLEAANIAPSVLSRILPSLRQPWSERIAFVASVAKRHPILMQHLWEDRILGSSWKQPDDNTRITGFPDALLLLEEEHRMTQTTTDH